MPSLRDQRSLVRLGAEVWSIFRDGERGFKAKRLGAVTAISESGVTVSGKLRSWEETPLLVGREAAVRYAREHVVRVPFG